jgi:hypothetical protein
MTDAVQILDDFCDVCTEVRMNYDFYCSIFEDDPQARELLLATAPFFFYDISRALVDRILLHFTKITDPAGSGTRTNLTTNYVLEKLPWPDGIRARLKEFNERMMIFRLKIEPARSKRITHIDLSMQTEKVDALGKFAKGEELYFLQDLQSFIDVAYGHLHDGRCRPIAVGASTDTYNLVRAIQKSVLYDQCVRCTEQQRITNFLASQ